MKAKRVFKYIIPMEDKPVIAMPVGAEILSLAVQCELLCLWALVDPDAPMGARKFRVAGTGHAIHHELGRFVGTALQAGGELVWHVWEIAPDGEQP